jgi:hypothetical protein
MSRSLTALVAAVTVGAAACGSGADEPTSLQASWTFSSGDCATTGVETVSITWGLVGGSPRTVDFACTDGGGTLGVIREGQSASIVAKGYDAGGIARVESYGQGVTLYNGAPPSVPVNITLNPKAANVIVSWSLPGGGGCPPGTIIPYFVILYEPPAVPGGPLTTEVKRVQESCSAPEATIERVAPGDYVVKLDSVTTTPKVQMSAPVTLVAGEDAYVHLSLL